MRLKEQLLLRKGDLVQGWFDLLLESYPAETARFLRTERNQFANPVGSTLYRGVEGLVEALLQGVSRDETSSLIESMVKIRAVQEQAPSRALGFIFLLKGLIRQKLAEETREGHVPLEDLARLESDIDDLALMAFDVFVACREKLYRLSLDQLAATTQPWLHRAQMLAESPVEPDPAQEESIP
jgi:hypothetical protein